MNLQLPATSADLIIDNVTVPSGYANYFTLAHQQMANSGEAMGDFLVRQMIYQSVERYKKFLIEEDYNMTIASGEAIQEKHGQFVMDINSEEKTILGDYGE